MSDPVFFRPARIYSVGEIAALTGANLLQPELASRQISAISPLSESGAEALVYAESLAYLAGLEGRDAAAVLCTSAVAGAVPAGMAVLEVAQPQLAFVLVARAMFPQAVEPHPYTGISGISAHAIILPGATIEEGVTVEAGAIVSPGAAVGAGSVIGPGAFVGEGCQIGRLCMIGPGASVHHSLIGDRVFIHAGSRIGQDGFGYVPGPEGLIKIPQIGRVVIQNDVEIGAGVTIDRGAMSDTVIGEGTKIDNLVQIAHNVRIGRYCILAGQCGIAGSVTIEDYAMLGGAVGIADHVTIGRGAKLAARAGVMHDLAAGGSYGGAPAVPAKDWLRSVAVLRRMAAKGNRKREDG